MTKERLFALKVGNGGQAAMKETVHKHITGDSTKVKVAYALNAEL